MPTLSDLDWQLRTAVYRHFAKSGSAPDLSQLATQLGLPLEEAERGLERLSAAHQLVLAPGETRLWMANPFSGIPTEYPVQSSDVRYYGNCAWDALGIPVVLERDTWTQTRCAQTGAPIEFGIKNGRLEGGSEVIHYAVPARSFYDNIAFT